MVHFLSSDINTENFIVEDDKSDLEDEYIDSEDIFAPEVICFPLSDGPAFQFTRDDILSTTSSTPSLSSIKSSGSRKRPRDKSVKKPILDLSSPQYLKPFDHGWKRELVFRAAVSDGTAKRNADIYYYTPKGKKVRSSREVIENLIGTDLTIDNFTFFKEPIGLNDPDKEIIREAKIRGDRDHSSTPPPAKRSNVSKTPKTGDKSNKAGTPPSTPTPVSPPPQSNDKTDDTSPSKSGTSGFATMPKIVLKSGRSSLKSKTLEPSPKSSGSKGKSVSFSDTLIITNIPRKSSRKSARSLKFDPTPATPTKAKKSPRRSPSPRKASKQSRRSLDSVNIDQEKDSVSKRRSSRGSDKNKRLRRSLDSVTVGVEVDVDKNKSRSPRGSKSRKKQPIELINFNNVALQTDGGSDDELERLKMNVMYLEQKVTVMEKIKTKLESNLKRVNDSEIESKSVIEALRVQLDESERSRIKLVGEIDNLNKEYRKLLDSSSSTSQKLYTTSPNRKSKQHLSATIDRLTANVSLNKSPEIWSKPSENNNSFTKPSFIIPRKDVPKLISNAMNSREDSSSKTEKLRNLSISRLVTTSTDNSCLDISYPKRSTATIAVDSDIGSSHRGRDGSVCAINNLYINSNPQVIDSDDSSMSSLSSDSSDSVEFVEEIKI